jgi:hypothetical protein
MRFFSSDKNESNDDDQSNVDVQNRAEDLNPDQAHDEHPERVSSDPVSVPQQRSGSPWADAPGTAQDDADAELADAERADGSAEQPPFHEPSAQPTAFGASTVGGAVAASAMANPQNDAWDVTDRDTDAASGVADDRSVAPGDGVVTDEASPWAGGLDGRTDQRTGSDAAGFDEARRDEARSDAAGFDEARSDEVRSNEDRRDVDAAMDDRGTFDDPRLRDELADTGGPDPTPPDVAVETDTVTTYGPDGTATSEETRAGADADRAGDEPALRDEGGFDDPTAVDPATRQPLDTDTDVNRDTDVDRDTFDDRGIATDRDTAADSDAVPAAAGVAAGAAAGATAGAVAAHRAADRATGADTTDIEARDTAVTPGAGGDTERPTGDRKPGTVAAPNLGSLFGESDAQTFHDRWRDVQLRFVDSPRDATNEAAALLDEAVDKLSANLRSQKDSLMHDSDDTEQLRVQLRGYRDMINRILDL